MEKNEKTKLVSIQLSPAFAIRLLSYHEVELENSWSAYSNGLNSGDEFLVDVASDSIHFHHCVVDILKDSLFGEN